MSTMTRRQRYRVDLREMMVQCETNYLHLMRLMPLLQERDAVHLTLPASDQSPRGVAVRVLERCRYTTVLELEPERLHALLPVPALTIRLYHDARSAEVTGARPWQRVPARHDYPNPGMHQQDEKLQWNRHLAEWLRHVNDHGGLRPETRSTRQQA
ncbi:DUF1249 domain-containing protein [Isoalcanivorax indicus]|uniref:DUF1249 domain-containing protein n=1 Tax=Isoalcanivorax indicus TaxID=2202653 RepID=UPI001FE525B8|nr:DUF1249 domain-containing protein [Isoalcanivorax indicus]